MSCQALFKSCAMNAVYGLTLWIGSDAAASNPLREWGSGGAGVARLALCGCAAEYVTQEAD